MQKTGRAGSRRVQVEQQLAQMLAGLAVPELSQEYPLISVTRVELTRDLKDGTVWITAAPTVDHAALVTAFVRRLPSWRRALRDQLSLRYFPNLHAKYDEGQAESIHIEALLDQVDRHD